MSGVVAFLSIGTLSTAVGWGAGSIASQIVKDHDTSSPLFLYMAFQDNHAPNQCPAKYLSRFPELPAALSRQCCKSHSLSSCKLLCTCVSGWVNERRCRDQTTG